MSAALLLESRRCPSAGSADLESASERLMMASIEATMLLAQEDRASEALVLVAPFRKVINESPWRTTWLGLVYLSTQAFEDALTAFDLALSVYPSLPEAIFGRARALQSLGRLEEALDAYDQGLRLDQQRASVFFERGNILRALGRRDAAIASYDEALRLQPAYPLALQAGGEILNELGHGDAALEFFTEALRLDPSLCKVWFDKGTILQSRGQWEDADMAFAAAASLAPGNADILCNRGVVLKQLGRHEEALTMQDEALRLRPAFSEALSNRGNILMALGQPEAAIASYDAALRLQPGHVEAHCNRALALQELGRLDEAHVGFETALRHDPTCAAARKNRGLFRLLRGDFENGLDDYECRAKPSDKKGSGPALPIWPGPAADFGRLAVFDEQGLGDSIMFARYLPWLAARGADVTFVCRPSLAPLMRSLGDTVRVVESLDPQARFDHRVDLAGLPRSLGTRLDNIPAQASYLRAEASRVAVWANRIGHHGFRVGICWHGNADRHAHLARSLPQSACAPLSKIAGVRLISLQKHDGLAGEQCADWIETLGESFDSQGGAFLDTAAAMVHCDLIITCDTSIAHLAGALGRPVWVLLKSNPDWRWQLDRDDSPWYPTMRLFRQSQSGGWTEVISRIAADLRANLDKNPQLRSARD